MKRSIYLLIGASLLAASCSTFADKEEPAVSAEPVVATIGAETRTQIGEKEGDAYKVVWNAGDRIIVSTGTSSKEKAIYATLDHGSASASFYPEDKAADFTNGAIAGYPVENMYLGEPDADKEVYFTIPEVQYYITDSFDPGAMPMISEVTDKAELNFFNAAGVIRLKLSTELQNMKVSSISVTSSDIISGECGYVPKSGKIFFDESMISSNEVTLECPQGVAVSNEPTAFHIVVPHQTYSDLIIRVTTTDGLQEKFTMKSGKEITVARSGIVNIPLVLKSATPAGKPKIEVKVTSVTFNNIRMEVNMTDVTSYYCGFQTKLSFQNDLDSGNLLESLPYFEPYTAPLSYSGSVGSFQESFSDVLIEPGQSYVIWFVPYNKDGVYASEDIVYAETMTKSFTSGGSKTVSYSDLVIDMTSISMTLESPGASFIYCQLMSDEQLTGFSSENEIIKEILKPGGASTVFDKSSDIFVKKFLKPGAPMTLVAVAIDGAGKYGPLLRETFYTEPIPYNSIKVNIDKDQDKVRENGAITWTATGGEVSEYRYILRETDNHLWLNTLGGSTQAAQDKMYLDSGLYYISHTIEPEAVLSGMVSGKEYVIVVVAADAEGNISMADSWIFTY